MFGSPPSQHGWIVHGVLERCSRQDVRQQASVTLDEGVEAVHLFRCSALPESLDQLVSPLKTVQEPTLLELKEYKDLRAVKDRLDAVEQVLEKYKDDLEDLRIGRLKVICVGFVQEVLHRMTYLLVARLGKKLGKVSHQEKKELADGPFEKNQIFEKKCGTYLDLANYNVKSPSEWFDAILVGVEKKTIEFFEGVADFPKEPQHLRHLILTTFIGARKGRDEESHIGMVKDPKKLDMAIKKVTEEILKTQLTSVGMEHIVPLIKAGIATCTSSLAKKEEEDGDIEEHEHVADLATNKKDDKKQRKSMKGVKVTFRVKKKCDLGCGVYVFGFHNNLGCGSTAKAVPLSSVDGEVWWTQITFSPNEQISYKYVVRRLEQDMKLSDTHERIIQSNPCAFETVWR